MVLSYSHMNHRVFHPVCVGVTSFIPLMSNWLLQQHSQYYRNKKNSCKNQKANYCTSKVTSKTPFNDWFPFFET